MAQRGSLRKQCPGCNRSPLVTEYDNHLAMCKGLTNTQCLICEREFHVTDDNSKKAAAVRACSRHFEARKCSEPLNPTPLFLFTIVGRKHRTQATISRDIEVQNDVVVDSSAHINIGTTVPTEVVPPDENSFSKTYLESTIMDILKYPAFYKLAKENGVLHQELCKTTHYGENTANHNIIRVNASHNRLIIREDGEPLVQDMNECIKDIFANNVEISKDNRVNGFTGTLDGCNRSYRLAKKQIVTLIENGGTTKKQKHINTSATDVVDESVEPEEVEVAVDIRDIDDPVPNILPPVLSFFKTNIECVIELICDDPIPFQQAALNDCLHEELTRITHFGPFPENHNLVKVQMKGTEMTVLHEGVRKEVVQKSGVEYIMQNNRKIYTDDRVSHYFDDIDITKTDRKLVQLLIHNKGHIVRDLLPISTVPDASYVHPGPDNYLARSRLVNYTRGLKISMKDFSYFCEPICKFTAIRHEGFWWQTTFNDRSGKRVAAKIVSEDTIFAKMYRLVTIFFENLHLHMDVGANSAVSTIRHDHDLDTVCDFIMANM